MPPPIPPPPPPSTSSSCNNLKKMGIPDTQTDFNQWLHAMKMVARLPGGMPTEFRRKLWLALSDRHIQTQGINWEEDGKIYLCEQWDEDDEELGIQIVKDLHRTGSSLCSGPSGIINQAKLKRVLLGYSRFNPVVGYCQGFNMLGALILQVMDKNESDSIKIMILLIEGLLPPGYFCGSLGGLQADMAVFRDLLTTKLPKLARHLQKLQGPEGAFEPPLTNVFTMQWFLTLFCTCLPINYVLRIWDLILIEGSDVLLRTALAIWGLLESRILATKTADDFYCKMGALSTELVNGNLIDCNSLVQRIVDIGPIADLQRLRDKHLKSITQLKESSNLRIFYSDDEGESDEDSRLAVTATAWGFRSGRRASLGITTNVRNNTDGKEKINLDISLLKKQYDKLRERQRQAHIILTSAVVRQPSLSSDCSSTLQVNQLLMGKNALISNKGKRLGPPQGSVPPVRISKVSKQSKAGMQKTPKTTETLHWKDMDERQRRGGIQCNDKQTGIKKSTPLDDRDGTRLESSKLIKSSSSSSAISNLSEIPSSSIGITRCSESSSYSEESNEDSSTDTSLCDDENQLFSTSSLEASPMKQRITPESIKEVPDEENLVVKTDDAQGFEFMPIGDTKHKDFILSGIAEEIDCEQHGKSYEENHSFDSEVVQTKEIIDLSGVPSIKDDESLSIAITSTSQLSPIPDIMHYVNMSIISPLNTPSSVLDISNSNEIIRDNIRIDESPATDAKISNVFNVNEDGVTNQLFERINATERPNKLDLNQIKKSEINEFMVTVTDSNCDSTLKIEKINFQNSSDGSCIPSSNEMSSPMGDLPLLPLNTNNNNNNNTNQSVPSTEFSKLSTETPKPVFSTETNKSCVYEVIKTPSPKDNLSNFDKVTSRVKFLKEKSFSMDDPSKGIDQEDVTKRSASEGLVSADLSAYKSKKMSAIIQENSLILDRIFRKTNCFEDNHSEEVLESIQNHASCSNTQQFVSCHADDKLLLDIDPVRGSFINTDLHTLDGELLISPKHVQLDKSIPGSSLEDPKSELKNQRLIVSSSKLAEELQYDIEVQQSEAVKSNSYENLVLNNNSEINISKTDLVIKRTEEQLARFKESELTYYVRKENFREIVTPEEEKETTDSIKDCDTQQSFQEGTVSLVPNRIAVDHSASNTTVHLITDTSELGASSQIIENQELFDTISLEDAPNSSKCTEIDALVMTGSKTDELIKKTEEQLARFRIHDRNVLERLEKRLSLIDFRSDEAVIKDAIFKEIERRSCSKTEEIIKKSEEQMSRLKIESPFIVKKSPTRPVIEDQMKGDAKSIMSSSKTEEIIKKTDEQLARFKAAAVSNAEKRKSRYEINELLQLKTESLEVADHFTGSEKFGLVRNQEEADALKVVQIPEEVQNFRTDEIIKRIEDGKLKLGDDYITTIKTIDYLKQSNANLSATLSSIESSIKAIDGLCDRDCGVQSDRINDTIDNLEKSLKQYDDMHAEPPLFMVHDYSNIHESRCKPMTPNRPSRSRTRREYSPRRKKEKDRESRSNVNLQKDHSCEHADTQSKDKQSPKTYTFHSYYSTSPPISPRVISPPKLILESMQTARPSSFKSSSHDRYHIQQDTQLIKFDKSPSSPIINKSYLESLKPAVPVASGRTTRSAENSPPFYPQLETFPSAVHNTVGIQNSLLRRHVGLDGEQSHIKSCENILMRFDYKNISAIAASFPISSALSPSPTKYSSLDIKHDAALNCSLAMSPNKTID
ncbi:serine-rich adhesin for platelets isoform X2 [Malaya genurostris]|nr:serine-rich adhesin for platelets isoform X2 [Malaya genurostris]XP_058468021.1 serine-rich adhesin for platelets isoform X2 [Malaya genurostris]XP_058468022.1 serine-rich adhesin for platelets isoform X2 [Malaya genurostris]